MPVIARHIGRQPGKGSPSTAVPDGDATEPILLPRHGRRPLGFAGTRLFTASAPPRDGLPGFAISVYQCGSTATYAAQVCIRPGGDGPDDVAANGSATGSVTVLPVSEAARCSQPPEIAAFLRRFDPACSVSVSMPPDADNDLWRQLAPMVTDYLDALRERYRALCTAILPPEPSTPLSSGVSNHVQHPNV